MFVTAVCFLFLLKLKWPKNKNIYDITCLGLEYVQNDIECGFACLGITSCFSYNLAAFSDLRGKLLCELLPSDKFNNSDKFRDRSLYHHFSIPLSTNSFSIALAFIPRASKFLLKRAPKCHCGLRATVCAWCFIAQNQAREIQCNVKLGAIARPNEPGMRRNIPKNTIGYQTYLNWAIHLAYHVCDFIWQDIRAVDMACHWPISNLGVHGYDA